jgi:transposase
MKFNEKLLSNDPQELKKIILSQQKILEDKREKSEAHFKIESQKQLDEISQLRQKHISDMNTLKQEHINEIASLRFQLQKALMHRFGARAEKDSRDQYNLFDEADLETEAVRAEIQQADAEITIAAHTRKPGGRKPLPQHLPRVRILHDLSEDEKICACGHALHKIGEDISEKAEFIPAQIKVIEHARCKYACRVCEGGVKMADLPLQIIPKSIAGPGLLAHVIVSKYTDHLPLYRQEQILQRLGIDIVRATLCFWVLRCATRLAPLVDLLREMIRAGSYTQADETTVQVFNEPDKTNISKSYMWVYCGGPPEKKAVVFEYQPSRSGESPEIFLQGFSGILQTDGYSGYNGFAMNENVKQAGCWAHARRKYMDIVKTSKTIGKAHEAILIIRKLYAIEKIARDQFFNSEQRYHLRQRLSVPILSDFKLWLEQTKKSVPPQSAIGKAIVYTLNQWAHLTTYVQDGEIQIDNNDVENLIRPFAIGRKNWMFMGSVSGAQAGAIIYSLMATCKVNTIEPYAYFKYIFDQLPRCKTQDDYQKLLPQFVNQNDLMKAYSQPTWV